MTRYAPYEHDAILRAFHALGLNNYELMDRLAQQHGLYLCLNTLRTHMRRLGLFPNPRLVMASPREEDRPTPNDRPDPLAVAQLHVPGFNREKMTLYGRPIRLDDVMRRTNAALKALEMPQILAKQGWEV